MIANNRIDWSSRVARAGELANRFPGAGEILCFYQEVLEFQNRLYTDISSRPAVDHSPEISFCQRLELTVSIKRLPELLSLVEKKAPSKLAEAAAGFSRNSADEQQQTFRDFLLRPDSGYEKPSSFFMRILFQPYAEYLAAAAAAELSGFSGSLCPVCGSKPQLVVLRPEGDGGKRFLVCNLCLTEWEFRRILCPACGEENYQQLPRYSSEDMLPVRVEACDSCKQYLKSVDMTLDGHAVPIVDEIATVPLDLWAVEHGYSKIVPNLMGF